MTNAGEGGALSPRQLLCTILESTCNLLPYSVLPYTSVAPHGQHLTHIKFFCSVAMSGRSSCVQMPDALEAPYRVAIVLTLFFSRAVDSLVSTAQKAVSKETSAFIPFCDVIEPCFGAMMSFSSNLIG